MDDVSTGPETGLDRDVRFQVYRHFVDTGKAPTVEGIAAALRIPEDAIERSFRRLAAARALVLAPGSLNVWMAHP